MKISIGADHRGFELKHLIIEHFGCACHPGPLSPRTLSRGGVHPIASMCCEFLDVGTFTADRTDYPLYAKKVCADVLAGHAEAGILICGSGVGMSIAANRYKRIYAALCWSVEVARHAKAYDGANILVLPSDFVEPEIAFQMIAVWLETPFDGGRYEQRLCMIDE